MFFQYHSSLRWHLLFIYTIKTSPSNTNKIFTISLIVSSVHPFLNLYPNFYDFQIMFSHCNCFFLFCNKLLLFKLLKILWTVSITHFLWIKYSFPLTSSAVFGLPSPHFDKDSFASVQFVSCSVSSSSFKWIFPLFLLPDFCYVLFWFRLQKCSTLYSFFSLLYLFKPTVLSQTLFHH